MSLEEAQGTEGSRGFRKVHAFVLESSVLIWDPHGRFALAVDYQCDCQNIIADVAYLRDKWRIVGGLIGALPSQPRQNAQLGLPLKLTPEETTLMMETGMHLASSPAI